MSMQRVDAREPSAIAIGSGEEETGVGWVRTLNVPGNQAHGWLRSDTTREGPAAAGPPNHRVEWVRAVCGSPIACIAPLDPCADR